jgi:PadR family transcriptional regulator, regulatory protein PadR
LPISLYDAAVRTFLAGAVQLHVLHHAAQDEIHGSWMTQELARHGYDVSPGTLYPLLHRLEASGLLTSRDDLADGRRVRRYAITDAGRRELAESRAALRELAAEVLDT